jgi:hypothetical protein
LYPAAAQPIRPVVNWETSVYRIALAGIGNTT